MSYLDRLKLKISANGPDHGATKVSKAPFVPFVASLPGPLRQTSAANEGRTTATNAMSLADEKAIRAWLELIEETDLATIADVLKRCQQDTEARDYFTGRAAAELPKPDPFPDDRRQCTECVNLRQGICTIAKPEAGALVVASRGYRPVNLPLRCAGYSPKPSDADQRIGAERWPGLIHQCPA